MFRTNYTMNVMISLKEEIILLVFNIFYNILILSTLSVSIGIVYFNVISLVFMILCLGSIIRYIIDLSIEKILYRLILNELFTLFLTGSVIATHEVNSLEIVMLVIHNIFSLVHFNIYRILMKQNLHDKVNPIFCSLKSNFQLEKREAGYTQHEVCSICLEENLTDLFQTKCKHIFHTTCINEWLVCNMNAFNCPLCRQKLKK